MAKRKRAKLPKGTHITTKRGKVKSTSAKQFRFLMARKLPFTLVKHGKRKRMNTKK